VITATCIALAGAPNNNGEPRCGVREGDIREAAEVRGCMRPVSVPGVHGASNNPCKK
jgi:hypothetical protein